MIDSAESSKRNRDVGLALVRHGIPTFPLSAVNKLPKIPKDEGGRGFHDRTADPGQIAEWVVLYPGCMWGIVPADIGAIAFDPDKPTSRAIYDRLGLEGCRTFYVATPGGRHVYFRNVAGLAGGPRLKLTDVGLTEPPEGGEPDDRLVVRMNAGYCVAPGCVRADGGRYRPRGTFADIAPLPDAVAWLLHHHDDPDRERADAPRRERRTIDPAQSVIAAFDAGHDVKAMLRAYGYKRRGKRWLAPTSASKLAGVVELDGKVYSHHGSDPLADGHAHDPFDIYRILEHGGDTRKAVRAAAALLGMERPAPEPTRRRDPFAGRRREVATL